MNDRSYSWNVNAIQVDGVQLTDDFRPLGRWPPLREMLGEILLVPEGVEDDPVDGQVIGFAHLRVVFVVNRIGGEVLQLVVLVGPSVCHDQHQHPNQQMTFIQQHVSGGASAAFRV